MMTFVLVLFTANAATSIPGFPTADACERAGFAAFERSREKFSMSMPEGLRYLCVPGPSKG